MAIILCAGPGTRLGSLTHTIPKAMLPLDGEPLLGHTLRWLRHHGTGGAAINLHHLPRVITDYVGDGSRWGMSVFYSYEDTLLGTAGAILPLGEWNNNEPFVVVYGDKWYQADLSALYKAHMRSSALMTIAVHHTDRPRGAGLVEMDADGWITRYEEKPAKPFSEWGNAGLYVCSPFIIPDIPEPPCDWGYDVIPALLCKYGTRKLLAVPIHGLAMDIGTPERYARARELAEQPGAIFLDRDGTINELAPPGQYITTREQFRFLPGVLDALAFLAQNSERQIAIWSNQPCVGNGTATQGEVDALHAWMVEQIESAGGRVDGLYVCPHEHGSGCSCRKPAPGMLLDAARDLGINLAKSAVVGDTEFDLQAAWSAGVRECHYVLTGRGEVPSRPFRYPFSGHKYTVTGDLADAARLIVARERRV